MLLHNPRVVILHVSRKFLLLFCRKILAMKNYSEKLKDQIIFFTREEIEWINKYGDWCDHLAQRKVLPKTEAQRRFVCVINHQLEPKFSHEFIWRKVEKALSNISNIESYISEIKNNEKIIDSNNQVIKSLKKQLSEFEDIEKEKKRLELVRQMNNQSGLVQEKSIFCILCGGDGGATGNCPRCGGNGMESDNP